MVRTRNNLGGNQHLVPKGPSPTNELENQEDGYPRRILLVGRKGLSNLHLPEPVLIVHRKDALPSSRACPGKCLLPPRSEPGIEHEGGRCVCLFVCLFVSLFVCFWRFLLGEGLSFLLIIY